MTRAEASALAATHLPPLPEGWSWVIDPCPDDYLRCYLIRDGSVRGYIMPTGRKPAHHATTFRGWTPVSYEDDRDHCVEWLVATALELDAQVAA